MDKIFAEFFQVLAQFPFTAQKMKFSIINYFENCGLATFTGEILNGKLHFLCSAWNQIIITKRGMHDLPYKLLNDLRVGILIN